MGLEGKCTKHRSSLNGTKRQLIDVSDKIILSKTYRHVYFNENKLVLT